MWPSLRNGAIISMLGLCVAAAAGLRDGERRVSNLAGDLASDDITGGLGNSARAVLRLSDEERFRIYEYAVLDKLPSAAKFNGESTHPITLANIVAALLKQAGNPLTADQVAAINRLGEDYEGQYANLVRGYGADTLRMLGRVIGQTGTGPGVATVRERERLRQSLTSLDSLRVVVGQFGGLSSISRTITRELRQAGASVVPLDEPDAVAQSAAA